MPADDFILAEDGLNVLDESGQPVLQEGDDIRQWFVLAEDGTDILDESAAPVLQEDVVFTQFAVVNPESARVVKS